VRCTGLTKYHRYTNHGHCQSWLLLEERGLITNKTKMIQTKITLEKDNKTMGQTKYNDSSEDIEIETKLHGFYGTPNIWKLKKVKHVIIQINITIVK
jgi:hypothetical protein